MSTAVKQLRERGERLLSPPCSLSALCRFASSCFFTGNKPVKCANTKCCMQPIKNRKINHQTSTKWHAVVEINGSRIEPNDAQILLISTGAHIIGYYIIWSILCVWIRLKCGFSYYKSASRRPIWGQAPCFCTKHLLYFWLMRLRWTNIRTSGWPSSLWHRSPSLVPSWDSLTLQNNEVWSCASNSRLIHGSDQR